MLQQQLLTHWKQTKTEKASHFSKKDTQIDNIHMKMFSIIIFREMRIKTTIRHPTAVRIIKTRNSKCW